MHIFKKKKKKIMASWSSNQFHCFYFCFAVYHIIITSKKVYISFTLILLQYLSLLLYRFDCQSNCMSNICHINFNLIWNVQEITNKKKNAHNSLVKRKHLIEIGLYNDKIDFQCLIKVNCIHGQSNQLDFINYGC